MLPSYHIHHQNDNEYLLDFFDAEDLADPFHPRRSLGIDDPPSQDPYLDVVAQNDSSSWSATQTLSDTGPAPPRASDTNIPHILSSLPPKPIPGPPRFAYAQVNIDLAPTQPSPPGPVDESTTPQQPVARSSRPPKRQREDQQAFVPPPQYTRSPEGLPPPPRRRSTRSRGLSLLDYTEEGVPPSRQQPEAGPSRPRKRIKTQEDEDLDYRLARAPAQSVAGPSRVSKRKRTATASDEDVEVEAPDCSGASELFIPEALRAGPSRQKKRKVSPEVNDLAVTRAVVASLPPPESVAVPSRLGPQTRSMTMRHLNLAVAPVASSSRAPPKLKTRTVSDKKGLKERGTKGRHKVKEETNEDDDKEYNDGEEDSDDEEDNDDGKGKERVWRCLYHGCNKSWSSKKKQHERDRNRHMETCHWEPFGRRMWTCPPCGKRCTRGDALTRHCKRLKCREKLKSQDYEDRLRANGNVDTSKCFDGKEPWDTKEGLKCWSLPRPEDNDEIFREVLIKLREIYKLTGREPCIHGYHPTS